MSTTVKPPRVGDPIIFRAQKDGPEHTVRPCSGNHRALWLSNYIILSCSKCKITKADLVPAEITSDEELEAERRDRRRQEPTEQEPSMPVIAEFEHIWPYVNGRHEPCVRCGKPYGPNAGSCTVIISTTGPTEQEYYRD